MFLLCKYFCYSNGQYSDPLCNSEPSQTLCVFAWQFLFFFFVGLHAEGRQRRSQRLRDYSELLRWQVLSVPWHWSGNKCHQFLQYFTEENSEYWSQKQTQSGNIHSIILDGHVRMSPFNIQTKCLMEGGVLSSFGHPPLNLTSFSTKCKVWGGGRGR